MKRTRNSANAMDVSVGEEGGVMSKDVLLASGAASLINSLQPCCREVHSKAKKNCAANLRCVWGLGEDKEGIWREPPSCLNLLGADRQALRRNSDVNGKHPVGLHNLGATCYLNVLIQALFHNKLLRQAVYSTPAPRGALTDVERVVQELGKTFVSLQHSASAVYSLNTFVDLLKLNAGEQQDPLEFNNLFYDKCFENGHPMSNLLGGKEFYRTTCTKCKNCTSTQPTPFRDFAVVIEGFNTLESAIKSSFAAETMTGENQYFCSNCSSKQDAERQCSIAEHPEVLFVALRRYVYDLKSMDKKKLKTSIAFPNDLNFHGETYRLVSVLYHKGATAHGGHYVADVMDWERETWWRCDDDNVCVVSNPSSSSLKRKKEVHIIDDTATSDGADNNRDAIDETDPSSSSSSGGGTSTGKVTKSSASKSKTSKSPKKSSTASSNTLDPFRDAYMISYVKVSKFTESKNADSSVPKDFQTFVENANAEFEKSVKDFKEGEDELRREVKKRKDVYRALTLNSPSSHDMFNLLPTQWLKHWITGEADRSNLGSGPSPLSSSSSSSSSSSETIDLTGVSQFESLTGFDLEKIKEGVFYPPSHLESFSLHACQHGKGIPSNLLSRFKMVTTQDYDKIMDTLLDAAKPKTDVDRFNRFNSTNFRCEDCESESQCVQKSREEQSGVYQRILQLIEDDLASSDPKPWALSKKWHKDFKACAPKESAASSTKKPKISKDKISNKDIFSIVNLDLQCEHGGLAPDAKKSKRFIEVSERTWKSICEEFHRGGPGDMGTIFAVNSTEAPCDKCNKEHSDKLSERNKGQVDRKKDVSMPGIKDLLKDEAVIPSYFFANSTFTTEFPKIVNMQDPRVNSGTHYLVSSKWLEKLRGYHRLHSSEDRPGPLLNDDLRCDCNRALIPEELSFLCGGENLANMTVEQAEDLNTTVVNDYLPKAQLVTEEQWLNLKICYGEAVSSFGVVAVDDSFDVKLVCDDGNLKWDPECCNECIKKRKEKFAEKVKSWDGEDSRFQVTILAPGQVAPGGSAVGVAATAAASAPERRQPQRASRRKQTQVSVSIDAAANIGNLKMKIYEALLNQNISESAPNCQRVFWQGTLIDAATQRLNEINPPLVQGAQLYVELVGGDDESNLMDLELLDSRGDRKAESGFLGTFLSSAPVTSSSSSSSGQPSMIIPLPGIAYATGL